VFEEGIGNPGYGPQKARRQLCAKGYARRCTVRRLMREMDVVDVRPRACAGSGLLVQFCSAPPKTVIVQKLILSALTLHVRWKTSVSAGTQDALHRVCDSGSIF
jgi:hypothetical protein